MAARYPFIVLGFIFCSTKRNAKNLASGAGVVCNRSKDFVCASPANNFRFESYATFVVLDRDILSSAMTFDDNPVSFSFGRLCQIEFNTMCLSSGVCI